MLALPANVDPSVAKRYRMFQVLKLLVVQVERAVEIWRRRGLILLGSDGLTPSGASPRRHVALYL